MRAPSLANMTPEERATRLFNRIMSLESQGKMDSVTFFAPMAIQAFQMLQEQAPLTLDQRYDLGRIAEVAGALPLAGAQADTILQTNRDHLLGLVLRARVAARAGDTAALREFDRRLLAAERTERSSQREEYTIHAADITAALTAARERSQ
jgi:hypothetical protein